MKTFARESCSLSGKSFYLWFYLGGIYFWLLTWWESSKLETSVKREWIPYLQGRLRWLNLELHYINSPHYLLWARLSFCQKIFTQSMFAVTELFLWCTLAIGLTLRTGSLVSLMACQFWKGEMRVLLLWESPSRESTGTEIWGSLA